MKLIIEKYEYENWKSLKKIVECNRFTRRIKTWWYKKKGYEVEEIE